MRKVVVMDGGDEGLGVWLGDRVGVLSPGLRGDEEEELVMVEGREEIMESQMAERMRRVLREQADEVSILGSLVGFA